MANHMFLKWFQVQVHQFSKHQCLFAYVWYRTVIFSLQCLMIGRVGLAVLGIVLLNFVGLHSDVIRSNWLMVLPRQTVKYLSMAFKTDFDDSKSLTGCFSFSPFMHAYPIVATLCLSITVFKTLYAGVTGTWETADLCWSTALMLHTNKNLNAAQSMTIKVDFEWEASTREYYCYYLELSYGVKNVTHWFDISV